MKTVCTQTLFAASGTTCKLSQRILQRTEATVTVEYASIKNAAIKAGDPLRVQSDVPSSSKKKPGRGGDKNLGPVRIFPSLLRSIGEIEIDLPTPGKIEAELQDLGGRSLAPLFSGYYDGTKQRIPLDVQNFPSGLYFCEVYVAGERYHRLITISR